MGTVLQWHGYMDTHGYKVHGYRAHGTEYMGTEYYLLGLGENFRFGQKLKISGLGKILGWVENFGFDGNFVFR